MGRVPGGQVRLDRLPQGRLAAGGLRWVLHARAPFASLRGAHYSSRALPRKILRGTRGGPSVCGRDPDGGSILPPAGAATVGVSRGRRGGRGAGQPAAVSPSNNRWGAERLRVGSASGRLPDTKERRGQEAAWPDHVGRSVWSARRGAASCASRL